MMPKRSTHKGSSSSRHKLLPKELLGQVKKEIANATRQLESFLAVQSYFAGGPLLGDMHGWPISPDFALYLIELLEFNDYDLVIEFGSGTSPVLIARTLAKIAPRRQGKQATVQVAFEHLELFHGQTLARLQQAGLAHAVQLVHAPLQPYAAANGNRYDYYACQNALTDSAQGTQPAGLRVLVLVDGPPAATGKHARYPALPVVLAQLAGAQLDILRDDYIREDEKEIAQLWLSDLQQAGYSPVFLEKKLEKDACLISVNTAAHA
jgi:hypothetical protein